jgi:hypothetical protein
MLLLYCLFLAELFIFNITHTHTTMPVKQFQKIAGRDPQMKDTDKSALYAIAQAAVNVELFTIPLYMTSLYSLHGTHQITGPNDYYRGRLWPGMSTTADPKTGNEKAFNAIFSVFIAEMLHLQLASNICKAIGVSPTFTSPMLQSPNFGWSCYGPDNTVIPHILDLKDTIAPYNSIKVSLGPVDENQVNLFLAIEETEEAAEKILADSGKYFPQIPFANWEVSYTEADLPMFGSIGYMYLSLFEYMSIMYTDGTTLWDNVFKAGSLQNDLFNVNDSSHVPEYPGMNATVTATQQDAALMQVVDMIQGITDQGEGKGVIPEIRKAAVTLLKNQNAAKLLQNKVKESFQPDADALEQDYPSYDDKGQKEEKSEDAAARVTYGKIDHYEAFAQVKQLLDGGTLQTWAQWHAEGNSWTAEMLMTPDYTQNKYPLPAASEIAGALNRLKENDTEKNLKMLSQVVAGAIKGVTTVLNDYWNGKTSTFPFPSMAGSGDRMSLCWAIFGQTPDLSFGVQPKLPGILYHSCQGLNLDPNNPGNPNSCAAVEVFHTCKGSNTCATEGGCGFVQSVHGGGSCGGSGSCGGGGKPSSCGSFGKPSGGCGHAGQPSAGCGHGGKSVANDNSKAKMIAAKSAGHGQAEVKSGCGQKADKNLCGPPSPKAPAYYSAPSDNKCATYGGCAVPISASQIYPSPDGKSNEGQMELFNFIGTEFQPVPINTMAYNSGDFVYNIAWDAYIAVLQTRNRPIPAKPKPSDIRLAFPPST